MNKVLLIGNVGKEPEIRKTNNGNEVALFSLATSEYWKDKTTNERKEMTEWHRITVFNQGLVSLVKNYVKKGTKLYVCGMLQTKKWVDKNGVDRYATEVVLNGFGAEMELIQSQTGCANFVGEDMPELAVSFVDEPMTDDDMSEDDIPF